MVSSFDAQRSALVAAGLGVMTLTGQVKSVREKADGSAHYVEFAGPGMKYSLEHTPAEGPLPRVGQVVQYLVSVTPIVTKAGGPFLIVKPMGMMAALDGLEHLLNGNGHVELVGVAGD